MRKPHLQLLQHLDLQCGPVQKHPLLRLPLPRDSSYDNQKRFTPSVIARHKVHLAQKHLWAFLCSDHIFTTDHTRIAIYHS